MLAWETTPGYAIHLLEYTNPNAHHGSMQSTDSPGPQNRQHQAATGVKAKSVELLKAERPVPFHTEATTLHFTIPVVEDYEVAAVTIS